MKLQFIDSSETLYGAVMRLLPDTFEIDFSADGYGAASRICSFRPDILVLSAALPGNDGLRVLQTVQSAGIHPMVLLITPLVSDYVMEQVRTAVEDVPGVVSAKIDLVFEPVWDKSRMSEEALVELGLDD